MTQTVRLTMPAKAEYLILARLALAGIAREVPMSESALADLKLAVTEVCGNAVRHAYGEDATGPVRVSFDVGENAIEVTVEDDGTGTMGLEVPEEVLIGEEPVEEGMGLAIIRAVVDELTVDGRPDGRPGTVVRLTKSLAG
ncbi:MAG TPA: ATP-binding protein [Gaiella sp.]|nr:ATP-binding protein [Gaiella sp.]